MAEPAGGDPGPPERSENAPLAGEHTDAPAPAELLAVCGIAEAFARDGLSLRETIARSGYRELRPRLTWTLIADALRDREDLAASWVEFSAEKPTSSGFALVRDGARWRVYAPATRERAVDERFGALTEAAAAYVLAELDFWVAVDDDGARDRPGG